MKWQVRKPLAMAHELVKACVQSGDVVVDATLGNGHDALFLANCVGARGRVIGFDVQQAAVEASSARLADCEATVDLHHCGHEKLADFAPAGLGAVMFNLGYLPNADHSVITLPATTLAALESAVELMRPRGILSVMCYPGHDGGREEANEVEAYFAALPRHGWQVVKHQHLNGPATSPFLLAAQKRAE